MIQNVIKLWKQLLNLASLKTDKGELIIENELAEGVEVFVEVEGEYKPAEDGEYKLEDKIIVVLEGKVSEIRMIEEEIVEEKVELEEPVIEEVIIEENPHEDCLKRIEELETIIKEKDELIEKLSEQLKEKEEIINSLKEPVAEPAKEEFKKATKTGALRYF